MNKKRFGALAGAVLALALVLTSTISTHMETAGTDPGKLPPLRMNEIKTRGTDPGKLPPL